MTASITPTGHHALVFGASGLAGWSLVDQLLSNYPAPGTFASVTALVNRSLNLSDSHWPRDSPLQPELNLVSGINLAEGTFDAFSTLLEKEVKNISNVTHVFYFPFKPEDNPKKEVEVNRKMLERVLVALDRLSSRLKFFVFPSGTKAYGIHIPGGVLTAPFEESMRLPSPHDETVSYYLFRDLLKKQSTGKQWTWCDICPDAIIGFAPHGSNFSLAGHWASYLSVYALVEGNGAKVPFPGTHDAYESQFNEVSAEILAKCAIWAALHPEQFGGGQMFNIADQARPSRMSERWSVIASYFGLEGTGPTDNPNSPKPSEYVKKHAAMLKEQTSKGNEIFKSAFLDSYGYYMTTDRQMSLERVRSAGFKEEINPNDSWFNAFDRFKAAGMLPSQAGGA